MSTKDEQAPKETVIDFTEIREKRLEEKRRTTERIFFRQLLGIYCVSEDSRTLREIEICDVSEHGCAFRVPFKAEDPWPKDMAELNIRLYFSQETYLPVALKIQNSRPLIEEGVRYIRYGCAIDEHMSSYEAYVQFVRFLKIYAVHSHQDNGKVTFFYV